MRSLYFRILLASLGTVLVSLAAFLATFFAMSRPAQGRLIHHFQDLQIEDAVVAFEKEGPPGASAYLARLSRSLGHTHYLTDAAGRDVVTGEDRSSLLNAPRPLLGGPPRIGDRIIVVAPSPDGQYRLIIVAPPPFNISEFAPYYALILAAVALLCWLLALGIVAPLRQLSGAVERFGRGELATRVPTRRLDEIGALARSFNTMAERIETLLTAERRLLQDLSHELRSPLARLNIAIELARTSPDRDLAAGRLQKEVDRLSRLIGTLLEVTRAEGDPSSFKAEPLRLHDVVQDVVQSCALEADARGCRIVADEQVVPPLYGNAELLRRALENVVRNAIRYAPEGTQIELRTEAHGSMTVISVRDSGRGVPEALLPRITQPFFRVDDARDARTGGVGLGLSIAQRAVQLHQGTLSVENAHPGLRVTISIPTAQATKTA